LVLGLAKEGGCDDVEADVLEDDGIKVDFVEDIDGRGDDGADLEEESVAVGRVLKALEPGEKSEIARLEALAAVDEAEDAITAVIAFRSASSFSFFAFSAASFSLSFFDLPNQSVKVAASGPTSSVLWADPPCLPRSRSRWISSMVRRSFLTVFNLIKPALLRSAIMRSLVETERPLLWAGLMKEASIHKRG
jgi:hypothetical protein